MAEISSCGTSLILRLTENDSVARNELVDLYGPLVFHCCAQHKLQSCDSADVMQNVFASAAKTIHRFELNQNSNSPLKGWLWTITKNKIRDHWRKQNNSTKAVGGTEANWNLSQIPESPDPVTGDVEASRLLHRALGQIENDFAPQTWSAFWKGTIEGQDTNVIAKELGLSPNSVRQAKSRVLRRLREQLGEVK